MEISLKTKYSDLQRLDGRTVVVTGASGVLGEHFCAGFAEKGANLALIDLDSKATQRLAKELATEYGVKALGIGCDIASAPDVDQMVKRVMGEFGSIDVLHNNAATKGRDVRAFFTSFEEYPLELWREIMAVNIDGMFLVAQRIGREMIAGGRGGSVIQTASIYGMLGVDDRIYEGSQYLGGAINTPAVYAASKAAVIGLTRYLSTYWAKHGIRVNCLVPGGVESGQNAEFSKKYSARVPLGRMAQADEMVSAVLYLASDASSYVTGQVLAVDGGLSAW